jgi:hypothetical protein
MQPKAIAPKTFEDLTKLLAICGVTVSFLWGIFEWSQARQSAARQAEFESKKPFLTRQLELYAEAAKTTAQLSNAIGTDDGQRFERRFWELYWGELALVENVDVESAMREYGKALEARARPEELKRLSLRLAHAMRSSLDKSWQIKAWTVRD